MENKEEFYEYYLFAKKHMSKIKKFHVDDRFKDKKSLKDNGTDRLFIGESDSYETDLETKNALKAFYPRIQKAFRLELENDEILSHEHVKIMRTAVVLTHPNKGYKFEFILYPNKFAIYLKNRTQTVEESLKTVCEGKYISSKDVYYNKDKFDNGEINLCFITGHSGSGKSTMANKMENDGIEKYELDDVTSNHRFTDSELKEYGNLISSFFSGPGKKYRVRSEEELTECIKKLDKKNHGDEKKSDDEFWGGITRDFVKFSKSYAKSHTNKKFVVEGVWILDYCKPSDFKDCALYIKGTSLLKSRWRAAKRDSTDAPNPLKSRIQNFTNKQLWNANADSEQVLKEWRSYFTKKGE